jgi:hypothetical protein
VVVSVRAFETRTRDNKTEKRFNDIQSFRMATRTKRKRLKVTVERLIVKRDGNLLNYGDAQLGVGDHRNLTVDSSNEHSVTNLLSE